MRRVVASSVAAIVLLLASTFPAKADPQLIDGHVQVRQIPFSNWLDAQTTTLVLFEGRVSSLPFSPISNLGVVDYANKLTASAHLSYGFAATGTIQVTTYPDGTGQVRVNENFSNALSWTVNTAGIIFGYTATELAHATGTPALATCHVQGVYSGPDASTPEPDFASVLFFGGGSATSVKFFSEVPRPLRSAFGL